MSASFEEVAGFVLNYEPAGERHRRGYIFGPIGLSLCLFREQKSLKTGCLPDFLDEVECQLKLSNSSNGLPFVGDFKIIASNRELCFDPNSFFAASKIARFYLDNGAHLLDPIPHYTLLKRAILSLPNAESKNLVLLKLYFEFSRKEGLPVREAWLRELPSDRRRLAESWLSLPIKKVSADDEALNDILDLLRNWMNSETELQV